MMDPVCTISTLTENFDIPSQFFQASENLQMVSLETFEKSILSK
jgi:hypothetical protein